MYKRAGANITVRRGQKVQLDNFVERQGKRRARVISGASSSGVSSHFLNDTLYGDENCRDAAGPNDPDGSSPPPRKKRKTDQLQPSRSFPNLNLRSGGLTPSKPNGRATHQDSLSTNFSTGKKLRTMPSRTSARLTLLVSHFFSTF